MRVCVVSRSAADVCWRWRVFKLFKRGVKHQSERKPPARGARLSLDKCMLRPLLRPLLPAIGEASMAGFWFLRLLSIVRDSIRSTVRKGVSLQLFKIPMPSPVAPVRWVFRRKPIPNLAASCVLFQSVYIVHALARLWPISPITRLANRYWPLSPLHRDLYEPGPTQNGLVCSRLSPCSGPERDDIVINMPDLPRVSNPLGRRRV